MNNFTQINVQLLLSLQALLTEKHISRAAVKLFKSQPAVSHHLAELRQIFNDPLLVRQNGKLELTSRAEELLIPLNEIFNQLQFLLTPNYFDPSNAKRTFRLGLSDYGTSVILPNLIQDLRSSAPQVNLEITHTSREMMYFQVMNGELDFAFGVFTENLKQEIESFILFQENFLCLVDSKSYPEPLTLLQWLESPHILVALQPKSPSEIDKVLSTQGLKRRITITVPHWRVANELIKDTDLILTVAARNLNQIFDQQCLKIFNPPLEIPPFNFEMIWHSRFNQDPAHSWFRQKIISKFRA